MHKLMKRGPRQLAANQINHFHERKGTKKKKCLLHTSDLHVRISKLYFDPRVSVSIYKSTRASL